MVFVMDRLARAVDNELLFFDGRILDRGSLERGQDWSRHLIFKPKTLTSNNKADRRTPNFLAMTAYELYFNESQRKMMERLFGGTHHEASLAKIETILLGNRRTTLDLHSELASRAIGLFGFSEIRKALDAANKADKIVEQRFFAPGVFDELVSHAFGRMEDPVACLADRKAITSRVRRIKRAGPNTKLILLHPTGQGKKAAHLGLRPLRLCDIRLSDLKAFEDNLPHFQENCFTVGRMHRVMSEIRPRVAKISRSSFYRRFISENGLLYRNARTRFSVVNLAKKKQCRLLQLHLMSRILESPAQIAFYDESTIGMEMLFKKTWCRHDRPPHRHIKGPPQYLKLNMVCTLDRVISFSVTKDKFGSGDVADFLEATVSLIARESPAAPPPFLVLDNGPKNRSQRIRDLAERRLVRLVYTTPTTPQQNFMECVFQAVKGRLGRMPVPRNGEETGLRIAELTASLLSVLQNVAQSDFFPIKCAYVHELRKTM